MEDTELEEFLSQLDLSIEEEAYTRPLNLPDAEFLHALAQNLFERKDQQRGRFSPEAEALRKTIDDVAAVISRTYAERGDYSSLSDDEALILIREVLLRYNPTIINRNKKKRLPRV